MCVGVPQWHTQASKRQAKATTSHESKKRKWAKGHTICLGKNNPTAKKGGKKKKGEKERKELGERSKGRKEKRGGATKIPGGRCVVVVVRGVVADKACGEKGNEGGEPVRDRRSKEKRRASVCVFNRISLAFLQRALASRPFVGFAAQLTRRNAGGWGFGPSGGSDHLSSLLLRAGSTATQPFCTPVAPTQMRPRGN